MLVLQKDTQTMRVKIHLILLLHELYQLHYWIFTYCEDGKWILFVRKCYVIWFDSDFINCRICTTVFAEEQEKLSCFHSTTMYVITNWTYVAVTWYTGQFLSVLSFFAKSDSTVILTWHCNCVILCTCMCDFCWP